MFIVRDITTEKKREELLEEQAIRDPLTQLYNYAYGRKQIDAFLKEKDPYNTCGMILLDIDYFKYVNDTFGHLFGDKVLIGLAELLKRVFYDNSIIMRFGGDEFVVFIKNISHADMMQKGMQLIESVRKLKFEGKDFSMSCSAGICFLPENESGYTYDQMFENADWVLYRAKEGGRDQYVFCDHLRRFEQSSPNNFSAGIDDARYLRNDIISTAFEVFDKANSFSQAVIQLMEIIGYRFRLDRITIIRTDIQEKNTGRQYQWTSAYAPEVLREKADFTKEDFITLFHSYDEYKTTVLQHDNMSMYSPQGAALLMQGEAKTVLYAAMYCDGKYTGAISYVTCREKRFWSRQSRKELGEVTKIISAHLARSLAVNGEEENNPDSYDYDSLTGLISFSRFRVELERLIIGNYRVGDYILYIDFAGFKYFNHKYGYGRGDELLKEFCNYVIKEGGSEEGVYFTRVVSDQFLLLIPRKVSENIIERLTEFCNGFHEFAAETMQAFIPRMRIGVYQIEQDCVGASFAIDAANYARMQINVKREGSHTIVKVYDDESKRKKQLENVIYNDIDEAFAEERFEVYLQPKFSLDDLHVTGAEALVRWNTKEGKLLLPDQFFPLFEDTGRIRELDYYVFDKVVAFLAKNKQLGRKQVPISVNASLIHASDEGAAERYREILEKYGIEPKYTEIELTETSAVDNYEDVMVLFDQLRNIGIRTAIDDFGAGYSIINSIINVPLDTIKLDRKFISRCSESEKGMYFIKRIIEMIEDFGCHVICEGVETLKQAHMFKNAGCDEAQGFFF
jgi:diguanylate cyclase (GGDEF)-like protein